MREKEEEKLRMTAGWDGKKIWNNKRIPAQIE
jgi:hypothetical protein